MKAIERYQGVLHTVGWLVFIGLPFLTLPSFLWNPQDLLSIGTAQLLTGGVMIVFFYYNLNQLTPALLMQQQRRRFVLVLVGALVTVCLVKLACYYGLPQAPRPWAKPGGRHKPYGPWPGVLSVSFSFSFITMLSSLIALSRHHTRLRDQQQQMVIGKVSAELAMLKLQVSPHFLFNTLNNIRWLARQKADQTEAAVVKLSQLLRYMLYQAQRDRVSLTQEIEQLHYYIDLQRMRLTDRQTVDFAVQGPVEGLLIEPLLFIPFVENAFKYGLHGQEKSSISIQLSVEGQQLTFVVDNPLFAQASKSTEDSGIGISNVAQRLTLHYPGRHILTYGEDKGRFRVKLVIEAEGTPAPKVPRPVSVDV
ncbi:sensor histidine kinase [Fibrella sp. WM1]|uniref:sensor histidine kinase n=1 Tax=Fibrella musci TaxID=3242485 RepID=UPI003520E604